MDNEYLKKIDDSTSINEQIESINHDFTVLAKRIQEQSKTISLFDTIHIESIYTKNDTTEEPAHFIATQWNTMANYSGVFISGGSPWTFQGQSIKSGDILIKLPGNELLLIDNQTKTFIPYTYNASSAEVSYHEADDSTSTISLSTIWGNYTGHVTHLTLTSSAAFWRQSLAGSTTFYLANGEAVIWDGSYCTNAVPSTVINALGINNANPLNVVILSREI